MRQIAILHSGSITPVTLANSAAQSPLFTPVTIPQEEIALGRRFRVKLWGVYSTHSSAPTMQFILVNTGSNTVVTPARTLPASAENLAWSYESEMLCYDVAYGGVALARAKAEFQTNIDGTGIILYCPLATEVGATIGGNLTLGVNGLWSAAHASNTLTVQSSEVEVY